MKHDHDYRSMVCIGQGQRCPTIKKHFRLKWKTRPDTRQSSRGRLGRSSNAKTARNFRNISLRPTDVPTNTVRCRVACPRLKIEKQISNRPKSIFEYLLGPLDLTLSFFYLWILRIPTQNLIPDLKLANLLSYQIEVFRGHKFSFFSRRLATP